MTTEEIIRKAIATLPGQIEETELRLLDARLQRDDWENQIRDYEAVILLGGAIDGKNAEARSAQLRQALAQYRSRSVELERNFDLARIELHRLANEFAAAKALARLLAGSEEE